MYTQLQVRVTSNIILALLAWRKFLPLDRHHEKYFEHWNEAFSASNFSSQTRFWQCPSDKYIYNQWGFILVCSDRQWKDPGNAGIERRQAYSSVKKAKCDKVSLWFTACSGETQRIRLRWSAPLKLQQRLCLQRERISLKHVLSRSHTHVHCVLGELSRW